MDACGLAIDSETVNAVRTSRIVRWSFVRDDQMICCELGLDQNESIYELTTRVPWGMSSLERFADVHAAIQRQVAIERLLLDEGWSLDRFESTTTTR